MALQGPFFGKKEADHTPTRVPGSHLGVKSPLNPVGGAGGQPFSPAAPANVLTPASAPAAAGGSAMLTVGPNIKLKGVEITDCDTLLVEGTVEATMKSRVIQIADKGTFKGSVEVDIAEVRGTFDGDLIAHEKLVIFATGEVSGKTRYGKIIIEEGGRLSGEVAHGVTKDDTSATKSV
ncbi:MAG: polymer-forming cytoskeletal protein [Burkholderiaceae bacterium]|nr:MAG: polymer-forming cytoskeletal protein [Burkholderiaceae bacterium]